MCAMREKMLRRQQHTCTAGVCVVSVDCVHGDEGWTRGALRLGYCNAVAQR
mgnify:CR=1 FL=1